MGSIGIIVVIIVIGLMGEQTINVLTMILQTMIVQLVHKAFVEHVVVILLVQQFNVMGLQS